MAAIKMEALRTFAGTEGFVRRGEQFFVDTERRVKDLSDRKLAKRLENETPKEVPEQVVPPPANTAKVHLIEPVGEPVIVERPPFKEAVKHVGGGWYEMPNGERISGKEAAQAVYERGDFDG